MRGRGAMPGADRTRAGRAAARPAPVLALVLALALGPAWVGCGGAEREPEAHAARGRVVRVEAAGRRILIDHEAVPGVMEAMRMTLPVQDQAEALALAPGDAVAFELVLGDQPYARNLRKLPADTPLELGDAAGGEAPAAPGHAP